jgi:hypothetical protein
MATSLIIHDETTSGRKLHTLILAGLTEHLSIRDLIRARIQREVETFNSGNMDCFQGLVAPVAAERTEHGYRLRERRAIDWERQYQRALDAFERGGFVVEVGDQVANSLDLTFEIKPETRVSFVKLAPLVAG